MTSLSLIFSAEVPQLLMLFLLIIFIKYLKEKREMLNLSSYSSLNHVTKSQKHTRQDIPIFVRLEKKESVRQAYMNIEIFEGFAGNSLRWNDERKAELGENYICPEDVDIGFKVFTIGGTTIRWNTMDDETLKELSDDDYSKGDRDNLDFMPNSSDLDIVYEIMLRQYGIPLSTPIEKMPEISGRTYSFADAVVVCLEPEIDDTLIERLASIEPIPAKFILRDSAFGDDIELKDVSYRKLSALIRNHQTEEERRSKYNNYTVEFI